MSVLRLLVIKTKEPSGWLAHYFTNPSSMENDKSHFFNWLEFDEGWILVTAIRALLQYFASRAQERKKKVARRKGKPLSKKRRPKRTRKEDK